MKTLVLLSAILIATVNLYSQDCKAFYYLKDGEVQMTMYDKKGAESGKVTYTISGSATAGGSTTANFNSEMVNEKGKTFSKASGKYKCSGGVMYIDARIAMPQEQLRAFKDMEVKADEVFIEYPASMSVGQTLKDANFSMEVYNKDNLFSTVTYDAINRKVESKETVTTPAGTWECWKISYDAKFKSSIAPLNIGVPINMQGTEWFAPGFGIVKTETMNKNGKFLGSTQITSVKNK